MHKIRLPTDKHTAQKYKPKCCDPSTWSLGAGSLTTIVLQPAQKNKYVTWLLGHLFKDILFRPWLA